MDYLLESHSSQSAHDGSYKITFGYFFFQQISAFAEKYLHEALRD